MDTIYRNSGRVTTISKEFLDDQLGEKDWNKETVVSGLKTIYGDVVFRLRGRNEVDSDSWDYNIMTRDLP